MTQANQPSQTNQLPNTAHVPSHVLDQWLVRAIEKRASDLHLEPVESGYEIRFRVDGRLHTESTLTQEVGRALVLQAMVRAELLTFRLNVPQEGRIVIQGLTQHAGMEARIAVIPTIRGVRGVFRLPAEATQPKGLENVGLPDNVKEGINNFVHSDSGMLLLVGPAGSGKTTTCYAVLERICQAQPGLSVVSLEDPVERRLPGVTQIEVTPFGELTYERALRSILRQDPQVLAIGEIRDAATAMLAVQAGLSGHRLVCTLHAGGPGQALSRLVEMGVAPYQTAGAVAGILSIRLVRRKGPSGSGRIPVASFAKMNNEIAKAVLDGLSASQMDALFAKDPNYRDLAQEAKRLIDAGEASVEDLRCLTG
jgi:type II secretory ATPase GspE/PulE/Tfp pilus assembly ATPase PilB-like protein